MERLSLEQYLTQVIWPAFLTTMTVMACSYYGCFKRGWTSS